MSGSAVDTYTTFGDLLRHFRRRARLTQRELGIAVGYSESQIARLEANQRLPAPSAIQARFLSALGLADQPELSARLLELAEATHREPDAAPTSAAAPGKTNLPVRLTRFIGREREMAAVRRLLSTHRLVTLTGSGGVGKTRLALEVAAGLSEAPPPSFTDAIADGIWLVELATSSEPRLVARNVAAVFGLTDRPGQNSLALIQHLKDKRLLLILDNCEHLVAACAELSEALLRACPHLHILATSREPLRANGEAVWRVPSMASPDPQSMPQLPERILAYEAVRLFVEHASAARPGFKPAPGEAPAIAHICYALDGNPLAIEMAAAQVTALSVNEIATGLDDRFALLSSGRRTALPQHQTLRAVLDWSYALLSPPEQTLLSRLAVFAGSWSADAARAVCADARADAHIDMRPDDGAANAPTDAGSTERPTALRPAEILPLLIQLVQQSMAVADDREGVTRYRLLETTRQYALERLNDCGDMDAIRRQHASYFIRMVERTDLPWPRVEDTAWYSRLETEYGNLREALEWCYSPGGDAVLGLRLAVTLAGFWQYRGWFWRAPGWTGEGQQLLESALAHTPDPPPALRAAALFWLVTMQSEHERAKPVAEECLTLSRQIGDKTFILVALTNLGQLATWERDYARAGTLFAETIALCRELGAHEHEASVLSYLGHCLIGQGQYAQAIDVLEQSLAIWRGAGIKWSSFGGSGRALLWLGRAEQLLGNYARAEAVLLDSLAAYRDAGDRNGAGWALTFLGDNALFTGDPALAGSHFREGLRLYADSEDPPGISVTLAGLSLALDRQGQIALAACLAGAAANIGSPRSLRWQLGGAENLIYDRAMETARARLTDERYAAEWARGRQLATPQAVALALGTPESSTSRQ
jgi:predicted ATPase